ncbi:MAG: IS5 family transposase, partial [Pseudomonadota bacterium]
MRQHGDPRSCLRSRSKRGQAGQALGRSRGGFGPKVHLTTDHDGLAIAFELTGGEAADSPVFEALIDAGPVEAPRAVVCDRGFCDRGHDSDANRAMARECRAVAIIPHRSNRTAIPARVAKALSRDRARIEQRMEQLKRFKRVALRCEKTARNSRSTAALAATLILLKSV